MNLLTFLDLKYPVLNFLNIFSSRVLLSYKPLSYKEKTCIPRVAKLQLAIHMWLFDFNIRFVEIFDRAPFLSQLIDMVNNAQNLMLYNYIPSINHDRSGLR